MNSYDKTENTDNNLQSSISILSSNKNAQEVLQSHAAMPLLEQNLIPPPKLNRIIYVKKSLSRKAKRRLKCFGIFLIIVAIICLFLGFVVLPLVFMNSIELQRLIMFTNLGLPSERSHFKMYEVKPGLRNLYVPVIDLESKQKILLGVWHLIPEMLIDAAITEENFDYDEALRNSNLSVLLYFHGTGEDRSSSYFKYTVLRYFFHVITFDYRSYGDSSKSVLSEDAVVNDCVQLYEWLTTKTKAPVFVWGHSLGTALAAHSLARLHLKRNVTQPVGLVLEAAFTKMSEELYVHPYGKILSWLPWFDATIVKPLERNGFIFNTSKNILSVDYPIMILCAEDDSIVPYTFGEKLNEIANNRTVVNTTLYYQFDKSLGYDHYFIYKDSFLPFFINYFHHVCLDERSINGTN